MRYYLVVQEKIRNFVVVRRYDGNGGTRIPEAGKVITHPQLDKLAHPRTHAHPKTLVLTL